MITRVADMVITILLTIVTLHMVITMLRTPPEDEERTIRQIKRSGFSIILLLVMGVITRNFKTILEQFSYHPEIMVLVGIVCLLLMGVFVSLGHVRRRNESSISVSPPVTSLPDPIQSNMSENVPPYTTVKRKISLKN